MDDTENKDLSFSSSERLNFVDKIKSEFLHKVLGFDPIQIFVSDESKLNHFEPENDVHNAIETLPSGKCKFLRNFRTIDGIIETTEVLEHPVYFKIDILRKAEEEFGVDIFEFYDNDLPEIFLKIQKAMPDEFRKRINQSS